MNRNQRGQWQLVYDDGTRNLARPLPDIETQWLDESGGRTWNVAGKGKTVSAPAGGPLYLLRLRKAKEVLIGATVGVTVDMQPTDGVLVWISETP